MKIFNNKKGFTLVEVIVVLVILAILAALMIPAMTGWIDKAQEQKYVADARLVYVAAQSAISEQYALNPYYSTAIKYNYYGLNTVGRVTSNMLYLLQRYPDHVAEDDKQINDVEVAKQVLKYLDSDGSNPRYVFGRSRGPKKNERVKDYMSAAGGQPGIVIFYDATGTVRVIEFGLDKYLVHIEDGVVTTKKGDDAKFSSKGLD